VDTDGSFEYSAEVKVDLGLPAQFAIDQNFPNPFNPSTTVNYSLPVEGIVNIKLYNSQGREVATILNELKEAGYHSITIDAAKLSLASGVYFYRLSAGGFTKTRKMLLLQ